MKEFAYNEVAGFQTWILLKVNFSYIYFSEFCQLLRIYFKEHVLMAASTIISSIFSFCLVNE